MRVSAAFDLLAERLAVDREGTALAYLATPTDAFYVPGEVVAGARAAYATRGASRIVQAPLRTVTGGRLLAPAYGRDDSVADIVVTQQGPNYVLAKRLQRWRGALAVSRGQLVSFNVAPAA